MKRKLTSILLFSALLMGGASTFVSCTDHESDSAYNTSISLADAVAKQKAAMDKANGELNGQIELLKNQIDQKADADEVAKLKAQLEALEERVAKNEEAIAGLANCSCAEKWNKLNELIMETAAYTDMDKLVKELYDNFGGDDNFAKWSKALTDIEELQEKTKNLEVLEGDVEEIKEGMAAKFKEVGDNISSLQDAIEEANKSLNDYQVQLDEIRADIDKIKNAIADILKKGVDGIVIQATESPVTGYENAAFLGAQANILSAYYGIPAEGSEEWGVKANSVLTAKGANAGYIYITVNPANVDPAGITFKLVDSQGNEAPGFKLGTPETTDKVLTYGVSRATSSNGFYRIPVICEDPQNDGVELDKGELKEAAKNVLAKLKNPKSSNLNVSQIATALYSNINNKLTAYGVEASWQQMDEEGNTVDKKATSKLNMTAFAVKPLSYNTLKDNASLKNLGLALDNYLLPTMSDKVEKYIKALDFKIEYEGSHPVEVVSLVASNKMFVTEDQEKKEVQIRDNYGNIKKTISNATLETYIMDETSSGDWFQDVYTWKHVENWYWNGSRWVNGSYDFYTYDRPETLYVIKTTDNTVDDTINDLLGQLNDQIGTQLQPVKDAIQNAANKWDNAVAPVNNLLHKINANISDLNQLLQPTMLYKSTKTNAWNTLSTLKGKLGTRMTGTGSTVLVATSWTAEVMAPAYKKSVYVKEAGANVTLMDGKTSAKTPFDGSVQKVLFNASKKGTYTVVYKAIDYSGVEATKEYTIVVE